MSSINNFRNFSIPYKCKVHFQQNFINWTSGNDDIDKFIQNTQLSAYIYAHILEWMPYDRFYNINYITEKKVYKANWIDGNISYWNDENQNLERENKNMIVTLKKLENPKNITSEFMNEIKIDHIFYGITQDLETKVYMMVLSDKCKKCKRLCYAIHFQQNFVNWNSGNNDIDKFIQNTQLLAHNSVNDILEWIPYNRFYNINCITKKKVYKANWIDGNISHWNDENQNWERKNQNMIVTMKKLKNLKNIELEFSNEIYKSYGITQNPETKYYMMILNDECKKCNHTCYAIHFQQNFVNWTSGNDVYKANWIDGNISHWNDENQNWERKNQNMIVTMKKLKNLKNIELEFSNEIYKSYGITQNPETKYYMMILNDECKKCNHTCYAIHFQQNFVNWTSGNDGIDKFIQDTQLSSAHKIEKEAFEWMPYDRFHNINCITKKKKVYKANWTDGNISHWNNENQNWERKNQNMIVTLKKLKNLKNIELEFSNEICESYGITQNPETKYYMMVLNDKCKKCNHTCYSIHFLQNFVNWSSGNNNIDKFIQDTQLSAHNNTQEVLEWISYDRFYNINYITETKVYKANWIDGNISHWNNKNQNLERENQNMIVTLRRLDNPKNITLEFMNEIRINYIFYGITQDLETKYYMMVFNDECKKCNHTCYAIHFQQNFVNWTSGNNDINKFIQDTQLSAHNNTQEVLEWILYDRLYNIIKGRFGKIYKADWIDGNISSWNYINHSWKRENQNIIVILKKLDDPKNITLEFMNEISGSYGITQSPETKNYMIVLNDKCKKCNCVCNSIHFQQNFVNWTSGNDNIDEFIQNTQLSAHYNTQEVLEWIPYDRLYNIIKGRFGKIYKADWIDGNISSWNYINQSWKRENQNIIVILKKLDNPKNITLEFMDEISGSYGITQNPETKNYMIVLNDKCKKCNYECNTIHFQQNFLSAHKSAREVLEWISYDRLYNINYIAEKKVYKVNWIDGNLSRWNNKNQNLERKNQNMIVTLRRLDNPKNITLEFMNEIRINYIFYGITQDFETKYYMMVLNDKCKRCNYICYAIRFQQNFVNWSSGNNDINKFIQDTQLSAHHNTQEVLEWIPYDRLYNIIKGRFSKIYKAGWIDGNISSWNYINHSWKRENQNIIVILKKLDDPKNITLEFMNEISGSYGITQSPETKNYMIVLNDKCKKCNCVCNSIHFQQNFVNWTSGNDDIDEFIQNTQLSAHYNTQEVLEWIPYDRLYNIIKGRFGKIYKADWIDGNISSWNYINQSWKRENQNIIVILKKLDNPKNITLEFMDEISGSYGITQNPETKNYMIVLNDKCKKCNYECNTIHFRQNFINWTSGNDDIDKFIQYTQLSAHGSNHDNDVFKDVLEWIPYDRFYNIKYIARGGFGKVYRANWIDGYIINWKSGFWNRHNENMFVALKSLDNSKNVTLEFMNEIASHNKGKINNTFIIGFYGMTQDPETKNYMMVLDYAEDGSLRNYLDREYSKLNWDEKIEYMFDIITGLYRIHNKELIHRDLHIGNILKLKYRIAITDMGLCKPANYIALGNAKNNIYGVLSYIAPEILRGQNTYSKAADIYSFGIIMYEIISGLPPYHDISHDENLAINICRGLRPRFNAKVPQLIVHSIKRCLDANPLNRPMAGEIKDTLRKWQYIPAELKAQIEEADEFNSDNLPIDSVTLTNLGLSYEIHSEAIYTSRLLDFNDLPEPKNSDDYYKQNDNIISKKFSESLQIDISQLNTSQ
ncbi:unnamed protein product [Rhizophagus irregularis]|nr:unnamed protein product [Rhizophagus irregularis]